MALTYQHCRSCGDSTPVDPTLPVKEQNCARCGQPCGDDQALDEWEQKRPLSEERIAELRASGHKPPEMVIMNCPHCRAMTPIASGLSLLKQRCLECGRLIEEEPGKSRRRKRSRFTPDGVLITNRSKEHVWMPMLGSMLIVVMAVIFWMWTKSRPEPGHAEREEPPPPLPRMEVKELAGKFMAARTPGELLPLVRNPAQIEGPLRAWCAARPGGLPLGGEILGYTKPRFAVNAQVMNVTILFKNTPRLNVLTVETPDGWRVDWAAFTGIAEIGVEDFLKNRPATPSTVLLNVRRSDYYNHAYSDAAKWQALRVSDRLDEYPFYAYVPRNNAAIMKALEVLPAGDTPERGTATVKASRRMALRLHFGHPAMEGAPQAEVTSIVGDGWYVP